MFFPQVRWMHLCYNTPWTCASMIVIEHVTYAVMCEGCHNKSTGGTKNCDVGSCDWGKSAACKEVKVLMSSVAVVYMLHKLNKQSVAQLKILYRLHGEFEKNHEKYVRIPNLPADLNWRLCKYMAEVWLARLWHLFGRWLISIAYPDHCNC